MPGESPVTLALLIGGIPLRLHIRPELLDPPMALFRATPPPDQPHPLFELSVQDDLPAPAVPPAGGAPSLRWEGNRLHLRGTHFEGCLDWSLGRGTFRQSPGTRYYRVALQVILTRRLLAADALLVHGAGLAGPAGGLLFVGPSGAGKSTVAELAGWPVLSDELCAVGLGRDGGAWIAGTPLGASTDARTLPLAEVFWLEQSSEDRLRPMRAAEAARRLLHHAVSGGFDDADLARMLDLVADLVARRPPRRLCFTRSRNFVELVGGTEG
jgi:hypothetical protein